MLMQGNPHMVKQETFSKYAIFANGGKQYQAIEGQTIALEKIEGQAGDTIELGSILFRKLDENKFEIGQPFVDGKITATIIKQMKEPKVVVFRFKRRGKVRVKNGHRQPKTVVRVLTIA